MIGTGFGANAFGWPRAVERGGRAPVDRRLHRAQVGAAFLDPELDPKQIAQERALGALVQMQYGRPLVRLLRDRRGRTAQSEIRYISGLGSGEFRIRKHTSNSH